MTQHWNTFERITYRRQPQFCGIVLGIAAIGMTAYGLATAPGSPQTQAPPPPSSSVQYGDDGEIISTQKYDEKTNTWITTGRNSEPQKPDDNIVPIGNGKLDKNGTPVFQDQAGYDADKAEYEKNLAEYETKHAEWQKTKDANEADKTKIAELRTKMLDNLNTTPEDRLKAYVEYQQAYADAAHKDLDPRFAKIDRTTDEQANATGMFGSRAYVDTKSELATDKLNADTDIANQAVMAKEQLASNDRTFYANMLNQIDSGARADNLTASQIAKNTSDISGNQYAGILGQYNARNNNAIAKWQADQARSASYTSAGSNLAGGLMYLYGNKSSRTPTQSPTESSTFNASKPDGEFT